jgi:hypothetical protein
LGFDWSLDVGIWCLIEFRDPTVQTAAALGYRMPSEWEPHLMPFASHAESN